MRVSYSSVLLTALLGSIPFASIVRSYPTAGYIDITETSKRATVPKPNSNPFRPNTPPTNPFKTPFDTPSPPSGGGGSAAAAWRSFSDDTLKIKDTKVEGLRAKGVGLLNDLELAITRQSSSKEIPSTAENGYTGQRAAEGPPGKELDYTFGKSPWESFGIDLKTNWVKDDIKKPGSTETIVKTYEDPKQKAIILSDSNNKAVDPAGKLSWTGMVASNWGAAAAKAGVPVSDLKYILRNKIQDRTTTSGTGDAKLELNTLTAMRGAYDAMKVDRSKVLVLDFKAPKDAVEAQQVGIMSAQTHIARVLQMLKDYRADFKDLQISKIHLQSTDTPVSQSQWNIIIELGR